MLRRLLPVAALAVALGLAACDEPLHPLTPEAVGDPGDVFVVTDSVTWAGPVGDALRATLGRSVAPPLDIADFSLKRRDLTNASFDVLRRYRNVIFAAPLDDTSAVARFLEARIDSAGIQTVREGRGSFVVPRRDVWATGQIVVLAAAGTDDLLAEAFRQNADTLRALFTGATLAQVRADMFDRARQVALEDSLMNAHGFAVNIQHDYFVSQDTTAAPAGLPGHFVRLRRVLSDTWRDFWVYYEDDVPAEPIDTAYVERVTDRLLETFVRGAYDSSFVRLDRVRPIRSDSTEIAGRPARETRGLWRMTEDFMGGPFVRYSFYVPEQHRLYVVFGMIYAPQHRFAGDKREFLRQLEVIARTFRTAEAPPAPAAR